MEISEAVRETLQVIAEGVVEFAGFEVAAASIVHDGFLYTAAVAGETPHVDDLTLAGDGEQLAQMVGNVVSNAVKYSDDGGSVDVSLRRERADDAVERSTSPSSTAGSASRPSTSRTSSRSSSGRTPRRLASARAPGSGCPLSTGSRDVTPAPSTSIHGLVTARRSP